MNTNEKDRENASPLKWYFSTPGVVIALLTVGPLALPLVWVHPRYSLTTKLVVSVIVIAVTVASLMAMRDLYLHLMEQIDSLDL